MVMVELWQTPTTADRLPLMVTLRQPIPWPGKLSARAAVARFDEERAPVSYTHLDVYKRQAEHSVPFRHFLRKSDDSSLLW